VLVYPASMPVSNRTQQVLADALRHHRAAMGSRWRRLPPGQQALLVLAHLRKGETYTALAGGFGVSTTTVFRYIREGVDVLAAVAPTLELDARCSRRPGGHLLNHRAWAARRWNAGSPPQAVRAGTYLPLGELSDVFPPSLRLL